MQKATQSLLILGNLAYTLGQASCGTTFKVNSYPNARRAGDSTNGYSPGQQFLTYLAGEDAGTFWSDINLEGISIIRSWPTDVTFEMWGDDGALQTCSFAPTCGYSVSNATLAQNFRSQQLEVGDVISLDVVFENNADSNAVANAFTPDAAFQTGKSIYQQIGCTDSECTEYMGVNSANMFNAFDFIPNTNTPYNYQIQAEFVSNPVAGTAGPMNVGSYHTKLMFTADGFLDNPERSNDIVGMRGIAIGVTLATVIGPPKSDSLLHVHTYTDDQAIHLTDTRCAQPDDQRGSAEGNSNMIYIVYPPPPPPSPPPPVALSPCTSDDDDTDGGDSDGGDSESEETCGTCDCDAATPQACWESQGGDCCGCDGGSSASGSDGSGSAACASSSASSASESGTDGEGDAEEGASSSESGSGGNVQRRRLQGDSNNGDGSADGDGDGSANGGDGSANGGDGAGTEESDDCDDDSDESDGDGDGDSDGDGDGDGDASGAEEATNGDGDATNGDGDATNAEDGTNNEEA